MWADDEHIFLMDESGKTFVVRSGKEFEILAENQLDDLFWSTPVYQMEIYCCVVQINYIVFGK